MTKCIVKTTGQFMLLTRSGSIKVGTATVVEKGEFVASRLRNGDLELLQDNLPDSVTQEDLITAGSVEALMASLNPKENPVAPKVKATRKGS